MIFNHREFLDAYGIEYREHGKNWGPGWIQICCPFCGDYGFHGGCNVAGGYFHCWRCKGHSIPNLIKELLNLNYRDAARIEKQFINLTEGGTIEKKVAKAKTIDWPTNCDSLDVSHKFYLESRSFNWRKVEDQWKLRGTGPIGNYKFRIIAPIFFNGQMVSYQGRDITDKQDQRYKACKIENEIIHHKHILYGIDYVTDRCMIVEGITDVWRLGPGAVATFGTEYTTEQVNLLAKRVKKAVVLFDAGASVAADKLEADLSALGVEVENWYLPKGDPGQLSDWGASVLMKDLNELQ